MRQNQPKCMGGSMAALRTQAQRAGMRARFRKMANTGMNRATLPFSCQTQVPMGEYRGWAAGQT